MKIPRKIFDEVADKQVYGKCLCNPGGMSHLATPFASPTCILSVAPKKGNADMKLHHETPKIYLRSQHPHRKTRLSVLPFVLVVALAGFFMTGRQSLSNTEVHVSRHKTPTPIADDRIMRPSFPQPEEVAEPKPAPVQRSMVEGVVRPGDTISALVGKSLTRQKIYNLSRASLEVFPLSLIRYGRPYQLSTVGGQFDSFTYDIDREEQLVIRNGENGFDISRQPIPFTVQTDVVRGTILSSLFQAVAKIGETGELALALADIFAWDIDFILDIRRGDSFQAVIERRFRNGKPAGYGRVLAADFVNRGQPFRAIYFQDGNHPGTYYDHEGNSLRKAFLKAPLAYTHISSGFTRRRFHPVKKTWKAHQAIDYAAPTGTPIKTVGDGTIIQKGYTKGNGNFLRIRHKGTYVTMYLHMSRYAKGMKLGKNVAQGELIGYVGSTGLATGPHLCFRMYDKGAPVNPLKVNSIPVGPVSREQMAEFDALTSQLVARLEGVGQHHAKLSGTAKPAQH
jgi:murein DD-endopeptidase MepM/ murein hydrolase activator NlpD